MDIAIRTLLNTWWELNQQIIIYYCKIYNTHKLYYTEIKTIHKKLLNISNQLLPIVIDKFKKFYEYELMLHFLNTNRYTNLDLKVRNDIEISLNDICNWLIEFTLVALKYRICVRLSTAIGDSIENNTLLKYIFASDNIEAYALNVFNAIDNNTIDAWIQTVKIDNLGFEYHEIIKPFINKYYKKDLNIIPLTQKMIDINYIKSYDHAAGNIYASVEKKSYHILGHTPKYIIDKATNINEYNIEKKLKKLVGY